MDSIKNNLLDMRYIAPYHYDGLEGWFVRISYYPDHKYENRKWHGKLFSFSSFSSKDEALQAAQVYRDEWIAKNKGRRFLRSGAGFCIARLPRNNTSGIVGVNRLDYERTGRGQQIYWQAHFSTPSGKAKYKPFSIRKHGEVGALRLAVQARRDGMLSYLIHRETHEDDGAYDLIGLYDDILSNLTDVKDSSSDPALIEIVQNQNVPATSKLEQIQARIGQQRFRRLVLEYFYYRCAVTGSTLLIRASHIKPWREATDHERLDPANGLALSPVYDAAFDLGLISFRGDGAIMIAAIFGENAALLGITGDEKIASLTDEHLVYLDWHRKNLFGRPIQNG